MIHNKKTLDHVDGYIPKTVRNFVRPDYYSTRLTPSQQRLYSCGRLALNILFSPFVVMSLTVYNSTRATIKAVEFMTTTAKLPFHFSQDKVYWAKTALQVADWTIAALSSPFYPIIKCSQLIIGIAKPTFLFNREPCLMRDRLKGLDSSLRKNACAVSASDVSNPEVIAVKAFISSLYNYAERWELISESHYAQALFAEHSSPGFIKTKKFLNRQRNDKIEEKFELLNAFQELFENSERFEEKREIINFLENFKTPRQKAALKMFLAKKEKTILEFSGIDFLQKDHCITNSVIKALNIPSLTLLRDRTTKSLKQLLKETNDWQTYQL